MSEVDVFGGIQTKLVEALRERADASRDRLEGDLNETETARVRGALVELRELEVLVDDCFEEWRRGNVRDD